MVQEGLCAPFWILRDGDENYGGIQDSDQVSPEKRTVIALKENGVSMMLTVEAPGLSFVELNDVLKASGFTNAVNMDGGRSITFLSKRATENNISRKSTLYYQESGTYFERPTASALMLVADDDATANVVPSVSGTTLTTDKDTYKAGEPINVTASSDVKGAWISMLKKDDADNATSFFWYYINGHHNDNSWANGDTYDICTDAICNNRDSVGESISLEPGDYRIVAFKSGSDGSYQIITQKEITVTEPDVPTEDYSLETDKTIYEVGDTIQFKATAPTVKTWVGLYLQSDVIPNDMSFFYYTLTPASQGKWCALNVPGPNVTEQDRHTSAIQHPIGSELPGGEYKVILFESFTGDGTYTVKESKNITLAGTSSVFNITYMDGDTELTGLTPATYKYVDSQAGLIALPRTVEKTGYTFKGWYDNSELSGSAIKYIPKGSAGNKTYYAKFEKNSYEVTFDTDGGSAVESQSVPYQEKATKPADDPTKEGFDFVGWVTTKGGTTIFDFDNTLITDNTTIYAGWREHKDGYEVTFNTGGGSQIISQVVTEGETATKPAEDPIRNGYTFDKWVTTENGNEEFDFSAPITGPTTIYAKWTAVEYTITYDLDGGTAGEAADNPTTYTIETTTITLKAPSKEGYTFDGWADDNGTVVEQIEKGSTGDINLTAKWKKDAGLTSDKSSYPLGSKIMVTANCDNEDSWVGLYKVGDKPGDTTQDPEAVTSFFWYSVAEHNDEAFNILAGKSNNRPEGIEAGQSYKLILFGDGGYSNILAQKEITITENTDDSTGELVLLDETRNDKIYNEGIAKRQGEPLLEYFWGDEVQVKATATGEGAWVGVYQDPKYSDTNVFDGDKVHGDALTWYYIDEFADKDYTANLLTANPDKPLTFGISYWAVLFSDSGKILDSKPFNYRTFNMDWQNAVNQNIKVELEWTSKVVNGEVQKPGVSVKQVNKNLDETFEETLEQDKDYFIKYVTPDSKEKGTYDIEITFNPSSTPNPEGTYHYLGNKTHTYTYVLKEKANEYIINYVLNDGENSADNPGIYETGTAIKLAAPSRTGYIFGGWYTTPDFQTDSAIEEIPSDAAQDFTLYAKWTKETAATYKITYVLDGGDNDASNPSGYTGDASISLKPAKKAGYDFIGWFFDKDFTEPADTIAKGTTGDLTLYAKFTKKAASRFYITTEVTGGSISDGAYVNAGEAFTVNYEANEGYELKSIIIDGEEVDITAYPTAYTFENVSADHQISVVFEKPEQVEPAVKIGTTFKYNKNTYKVTSTKSKTVAFTKAKNVKSLTVPATVKYKGKTYKVTAINAKAFTAKKISTVTVGKNVKQIKKYAFKSSKAKTVTLKTKLLTKKNVKGSLKGSKVKTVKVKVGTKSVNKKYVKKYKKYFTKANSGKKVTVK